MSIFSTPIPIIPVEAALSMGTTGTTTRAPTISEKSSEGFSIAHDHERGRNLGSLLSTGLSLRPMDPPRPYSPQEPEMAAQTTPAFSGAMSLSPPVLCGDVLNSPHAYDRSMKWESERDKYVQWLRMHGKSKVYIRNATNYLNHLGDDLKPESFLKIKEDDLFEWLIKVRENGLTGRGPLSDASMNSIKGTIRACFRRLNDGETPPSLRNIVVEKNRSRVARGDLPTSEEVLVLANALSTKMKAAFLTIRYTGARPSEVLKLKAEEISPDFFLTFKDTKTKDHRTVPLRNPKGIAALEEWIAQVAETGYIFPSREHPGESLNHQALWSAMSRAAKRIGVKPITPYNLRHLRGTELKGNPYRNDLMGWKSDATARNYDHVDMKDAAAYLEDWEGEEKDDGREVVDMMLAVQAHIASNPDLEKELTKSQEIMMRVLLASPEWRAQMEKIREMGGEDIPDGTG